ncbi:MAG: helix-turn-helix domain-containing protein [Thaumarchaeota archaeon]|nr:helix-turn-helix domain-containing protein [Nitrososphaerota archaeon]RNJ71609.1 MAG: ArsR family transcriptional regulator [Thaumarchaeota archaeon S13]RNJ72654.1 MAG: ArsR family transcriptional regulator [Thaumarchaeota archaeon S15]RNJ73188.1 MAG: ArsR family transcriptional regulator [Thaumarchaeota archaeon S14]MDD9813086.1 helix-turn-helix domain-containing protein [Nitrososphaerota archaeon]
MAMEAQSEPRRDGLVKSTSRRVRMIFSVMASPNRIDILRILNSKGPLTYSELKSLAGFRSKKESGKFAYHLRKLLKQSLVTLNRSEKRYTITNLGKLVLSLARQIEERSIIESGKMYVRTSHESIEEFKPYRITQSLTREGGLPPELAEKITEEVENRIYKYQTTYLTGSLIREMVNSVLLEHGNEEYRNKLARLGLPVYDINEMLSNVVNEDNGVEGLLFRTGQEVFAEHLLTNILSKDVADSHLSGDLHITNPGVWSMLPDTIFVNIRDLLEGGIDLGGKLPDAARPCAPKSADDLGALLSVAISLLSREASQELVIDGLVPMMARHARAGADVERRIADALVTSSVAPKYNSRPTLVTLRVPLGQDSKAVASLLAAYLSYARLTPTPRVGIVIDNSRGRVSDVSEAVSEIVALGGHVAFSKGMSSWGGIAASPHHESGSLSVHLGSVALNLPRLAFESNKDEVYFRARLALLMTPVLESMAHRKKAISDLTRRGLNPLLAKNTQYMQKITFSLDVNILGLREAVCDILQCADRSDAVMQKVLDTAIEIATKKGKETGDDVRVCMADSDATVRLATLDGAKYGKNSLINTIEAESYSAGVSVAASDLPSLTPKSAPVAEAARLSESLRGSLLVSVNLPEGSEPPAIRSAIEAAAGLYASFRPSMRVRTCGECGHKGVAAGSKCPKCKSVCVV